MDSFEIFNQKKLCTQDDPPRCADACPAGLDVRYIMRKVHSGDFDAALKKYRETVIFPGIISRICRAPCEAECIRAGYDEKLSIRVIEKACTRYAEKNEPERYAVRAKNVRAAVIGSGLCGLSCAIKLAEKGYGVDIYEMNVKPGGVLWDYGPKTLPAELIENEIKKALGGLDIKLHLGESPDSLTYSEVFAEGADNPANKTVPESASHSEDANTAVNGDVPDAFDPLSEVMRGVRAAKDIERRLKGFPVPVSGGEKPQKTGLYTQISKDEPVRNAVIPKNPQDGLSRDEAAEEASRCMQCSCMACVKECEFMKHYKRYPKHYINDAQQSLRTLKLLQAKLAARQTNSCNLCGLCGEICPNGVDMSQVYMHSRRIMLNNKNLPAAFHDFWLRDMAFSGSDEAALCRTQPGFDKCRYLFFPGCQMGGSKPDYIIETYKYLTDRLNGGVALDLNCCGAPSEWAGYTELTESVTSGFRKRWADMGEPVVILACPTCAKVFSRYHAGITVKSLWSVFTKSGLPEGHENGKGRTISLFDPCSSRYDLPAQAAVRGLIEKMGFNTHELKHHGKYSECCGYGGLIYGANPGLYEKIVRDRICESENDYLTYCTNCRDTFAAAGKRSLHILDLLFGDTLGNTLVGKPVSLSGKRENRRELRKKLLFEIWQEKCDMTEQTIKLEIPDALLRELDRRLILREDIIAVIRNAEQTGNKLLKNESGRFIAHLQIGIITYWAEYSALDDGFILHNAYSHRVQIGQVRA